MQQLSLLPSSATPKVDLKDVSRTEQHDDSPRFKQAYGEAETALKKDSMRNTTARDNHRSDLVDQNKDLADAESGNALPQDEERLPPEDGKALPPHTALLKLQDDGVRSDGGSGSSDGRTTSPLDSLGRAISVLSKANGPILEQGRANGTIVEAAPDPVLSASGAGSNGTMKGGTQNLGKGHFQFDINGASQLSESASAKLAELAAKATNTAEAGGAGVSGTSSASEKTVTGAAQASLLRGSPLSGIVNDAEGVVSQQASGLSGSAMNGAYPSALTPANDQAGFNKVLVGEFASQAPANATSDPVSGMQAESELRFKAAMESVQIARGTDTADSVDVNAIKLDASIQTAKGADIKAAEAQAQNVSKPYVSSLGIPVDDAEWSNQLGQKLMWMNARNIQSAELHLNPADLGPIDVRIQVGADQSSISFNTQNQSVRELLEANIHRLREMLNNPSQSESDQSGGTLAQDSGSQSQTQSNGESYSREIGGSDSTEVGEGERITESRSDSAEDRLVDAYV
ncbi:hypothetical protein A3765_02595 [Oleiphilus sp. HI0130]|uniref:flagellar hook-length control protein FliK n=1 Tax=Oleiphilus sp. HI0079 TaxID=1822254 RepID=UPI0007C38B5E|nr:flagellar hook-length control protein FliK [Oleiphilus sp. HI0079]KZZ15102.1 hypothetical protein A3750_12265 [Oleiphilus sp. HI0079]KZZ70934.1 hypothetical protein A3765_02595 [Oleiphilus sp. HI0130]